VEAGRGGDPLTRGLDGKIDIPMKTCAPTRAPMEPPAMTQEHETADLTEAPALLFTDSAADKVGELIREEGNPNLKLRVFVSGGGCSGFQYGFTFDENEEEGDTCVVTRGVKLLVDPMSFQYLAGAEIDYREDLEGAQFVIRNPNATTTCGCGSSFSA
jgi:iron-sulfur cluster insertion protein